MNNLDHISQSLKNIFWVKILKFFDADPGGKKSGSGMEKIRIRDKHPVSTRLDLRIENYINLYADCFVGRVDQTELAQ